jgi:hypothetical protein
MDNKSHHDVPQITLFSTDIELLEKLQPFSETLPYISYQGGTGPQVTASANLDAVWATLMVGVELFGAVPPFPPHEARVLQTPTEQQRRGLPRYGIVGVALSPGEHGSPESNLRLVLTCLLKAVRSFNSRGADQISRVGILPDDLELKKLNPETGFKIIREVYERSA